MLRCKNYETYNILRYPKTGKKVQTSSLQKRVGNLMFDFLLVNKGLDFCRDIQLDFYYSCPKCDWK